MEKKPQLLIIIVLLALLASFLGIVFVIVPNISKLKDISDRVAAKEQKLEVGRTEVASIKEAAQLINSAQRDIELLGVAIPDGPKTDEAIVQISQAAAQSGLKIKNAAISEGAAGYITISFSTAGSYQDTVSFISNLEKNLRPVKVADYTISGADSGNLVSATFDIAFPFIAAQPKASSTETPTNNEENTEVSNGQ